MKTFHFNSLEITNYRSYTKPIRFYFTVDEGLKLFTGINSVEPRLGGNAAGKTSFWDALVWCLYGTGISGDKISDTISWGAQCAKVNLILTVNNSQHILRREGPPVKVYLDNSQCTQEDIDRFLGLTKDQFLHSVLFGQEEPLFPDLAVPERGKLLDEVLDLEYWNRATELAGKKVTSLEKESNEIKINLASIQGQINGIQTEEVIQQQIKHWDETRTIQEMRLVQSENQWFLDREERVTALQKEETQWREKKLKELEDKANEVDLLDRKLLDKQDLLKEIPVVRDTSPLYDELREMQKEINSLENKKASAAAIFERADKELRFWDNNQTCPVCEQPITAKRKAEARKKSQDEAEKTRNEIQEFSKEIVDKINSFNELSASIETIEAAARQNEQQKRSLESECKQIEFQVTSIIKATESLVEEVNSGQNPFTKQIEELAAQQNPHSTFLATFRAEVNPYVDLLEKTKKERQMLLQQKATIDGELKQVESRCSSAEYWKHGFKRIRLFFIQQIMATLEVEIQSALSSLGLDNWKVRLTTESETKSGSTKLGVQVMVVCPSGATSTLKIWSGGEKQRLRQAVAMGLGSLIQRAAGVVYPIEVWDEPTRHLSPEGVEDLLQALQYRAESLKKSLWIIDHHALQYTGFKEIWLVDKQPTGSSIGLLSMAEV